jgi:hypothetical protein
LHSRGEGEWLYNSYRRFCAIFWLQQTGTRTDKKGDAQWCSPGMLTRGALQKWPELAGGGGGVQYHILEILNLVGDYSNNWDKLSTLFTILIKNNCR